MEKKVLIPSDISQPGKDYLAEKGYTIKMGRGTDEQTILEDVADCDALLARNEHITRAIMEAAPRLKVISKHGVGLDKIDLDAARELNIWVTNGPLSNTVAVAEHTMMLILACAKKLVFFDRAARRGDYDIRNRVKGMDLEGKSRSTGSPTGIWRERPWGCWAWARSATWWRRRPSTASAWR